MKLSITTSAAVAAACAVGLAIGLRAMAQPEAPAADKQKILSMIDQMSKPAEEHKVLGGLAGEWVVDGKMMIPGAPPLSMGGSIRNAWILGERFMQSEVNEGDGELKMAALSIFGFDTRTKKYTLYGIDTFGTYGIHASGVHDKAANTITFNGVDEADAQKLNFQVVIKLDGDSYSQDTALELEPGKWTPVATLKATRKK